MHGDTATALMSMLPLLIVIGIVWVFIARDRRKRGKEAAGPQGQTPYGVHGWLAFFVYASLTIGPFLLLGQVNNTLSGEEAKYPTIKTLDSWNTYKTLVWCATLAQIALSVWLILRLKNRFEAQSVRWVKAYLLIAPAAAAGVNVGIAAGVFGDYPAEAYGELIKGLVQSYVAAGIWFWYLSVSKRVKNTYYPAPVQPGTATSTTGPASATEAGRHQPAFATGSTAMPAGPGSTASKDAGGVEAALTQLKSLHDRGLITQQEYDSKRADVLGRL